MSQNIQVTLKVDFDNTDEVAEYTFDEVPASVLSGMKTAITSYNSQIDNVDRFAFVSSVFHGANGENPTGGIKSIYGARIAVIEETEIEPS